MSTLRAAIARIAGLFHRTRRDRDLDDEIASHVQLHIDDNVRAGMTPRDARRAALVKFGAVESIKERYRERRGLPLIEAFAQDVRVGTRMLFRQKGFTVVAVLLLAIGVGANTAVFSIVNVLLLKPRVGTTDGPVVGVYSRDRGHPDSYRAFSYPDYVDMRAHSEVFASLTAHGFALAGLTEGDATRRVFVDIVTANYFEAFGALPVLGRVFTADEERPAADIPVAILSDGAWRRLGGRQDVLGTTLRLNSRAFTIVGVAPVGFGGSLAMAAPDLWAPTGVYDTITNDFVREGLSAHLADRANYNLVVIARLARGQTIASMASPLDGLSRQMERALPVENKDRSLLLAPLSRMSVSTQPEDDSFLTGLSMALLTMSALVLMIASFNLANMLLARGSARRKEMAVRLAIGGSRGRLVRQLLTEGLVLSLMGGVVGMLLASVATSLLVRALTAVSPVVVSFDTAPDARVLIATLAFCTLSTLMFAALPAWKLVRTDTVPELKDQAGEVSQGRRSRMAASHVLVMAQLAISFVMLTVAALFVRGAVQAASANPGFTFERGVMMQVDSGLAGFNATRSREMYRRILDALRARPDVVAASFASVMPFGDISYSQNVQEAGAPIRPSGPRAAAELTTAEFTVVGREYFTTLGVPIVAGRDFTTDEEMDADAPRAVIIDDALAKRTFGNHDPIGRSIQYSLRDEHVPPVVMQVVGVAPPVRQNLFDTAPGPHLYVPFGRDFRSSMYVHVRTSGPAGAAEAALLPGFRQLVRSIEPTLPILSIETRPMFRDRNIPLALVRMGAAIFFVFGIFALSLCALGVYGLKAYLVSRRGREIGIRLALGATPGSVVRMVVKDGLVLGVIGLATGGALSALASVGMRSFTYQAHGAGVGLVLVALVVLVITSLLASWLPARRAARVDPSRILRQS